MIFGVGTKSLKTTFFCVCNPIHLSRKLPDLKEETVFWCGGFSFPTDFFVLFIFRNKKFIVNLFRCVSKQDQTSLGSIYFASWLEKKLIFCLYEHYRAKVDCEWKGHMGIERESDNFWSQPLEKKSHSVNNKSFRTTKLFVKKGNKSCEKITCVFSEKSCTK